MKIYCNECRYFKGQSRDIWYDHSCSHPDNAIKDYSGKIKDYRHPRDINRDLNCRSFVQKRGLIQRIMEKFGYESL